MKNQLKTIIAHNFFGVTSKMLYIICMKTESEFADVNLDFIRKFGITSAILRDCAKSEISQHVNTFKEI
jgi:hypothetical protein